MELRKACVSSHDPFVHESCTSVLCSQSLRPNRFGCGVTVISGALSERWPAATDTVCYLCTEPFAGPPASIPVAKHSATGGYAVFGTFCSWACASRYMATHRSILASSLHLSSVWLQDLANRLGYDQAVRPAPPRECLRKFGGPLDIDAFRGRTGPSITRLNTPYVPVQEALDGVPGVVRNLRRSTAKVERQERQQVRVGHYRRWREKNPKRKAATEPTKPASAPPSKRAATMRKWFPKL